GARRLMLPLKMNLGELPSGLAFRTEGVALERTADAAGDGDRIAPARVIWEAMPVLLTAADALRELSRKGPRPQAIDGAQAFLRELLAAGPCATADVQAAAAA